MTRRETRRERVELFMEFHRRMEPVWQRAGVIDPGQRASDWVRFLEQLDKQQGGGA